MKLLPLLRAALAATLALAAVAASAQIALTPYASPFTLPVAIANAGDGSGRLFVVEQAGRIHIVRNGVTGATPFLDIRNIVQSGGEEGLLGLAFHPNYALTGHFYVFYTAPPAGTGGGNDVVIARYRGAGDAADPATRQEILRIPHPQFGNHNGGALVFGPDGFLYIGVGDGGGGGDPFNAGQNLNDLRGKVLRIDVNAPAPYGIPPTNPFANQAGRRGEIYAYGLRNPWRITFDRASGAMYIGDVGQGAREEVDLVPAGSAGGQNFGWRVFEGTLCHNPSSGCALAGHVPPILEYAHDSNGGVSITGGYVYNGRAFRELRGHYVFGDYGSHRIWMITSFNGNGTANFTEVGTVSTPSTFGEDEDGELYVASHQGGTISRIGPPDADGDGLSDAFESFFFGNAMAGDPNVDTDSDGVTNLHEYREGLNPTAKDNDVFTVSRLFAMQQYRDFLSREGDNRGIEFWTAEMDLGARSRATMVETFIGSPEFEGVIAPVVRLYFAYFLRIPDYGGLQHWITQARAGATLPAISQAFASSPEFTNRYGALSNSQFVDRVYRNVLGRAPDSAGLAFWTGRLDSGAMSRGQVMLAFSESAEFRPIINAEVYVTMLYVGMLRRSPDTNGFNFWVGRIDAGNSARALIESFLAAEEYRRRFLP